MSIVLILIILREAFGAQFDRWEVDMSGFLILQDVGYVLIQYVPVVVI